MRVFKSSLLARFGVFIGGVSLSLIFGAASASAATETWTGATNTDFNTASNWSPASVPGSTDDVVLSITGLSSSKILILSAPVTVNSITVSGTNASQYGYTINSSIITVNAGIVNSTNIALTLGSSLTLGGNQTIAGLSGISTTAVNLNGFDLAVTGTLSSASSNGSITGHGNISVASSGTIYMPDASPSWTGNLSVASGGVVFALNGGSLGSTTNAVTVTAGGTLGFCTPNGASVAQAITIAGTGISSNAYSAAITSNSGCFQQSDATGNITFSGSVTLTADATIYTDGTVTITGPLTGAHTLTLAQGSPGTLVINSSSNTSSTPNSTSNAPVTTQTYSANSPSTNITLGTNQTGIVDGTYGTVDVSGGTLKGIGTIGYLSMSSGILAPGHSPGILNAGNTTLTGGTYQAELGGTTPGQYDQLNVTGTVDVGTSVTTLDVSLYGGFLPKVGNTFTIINNDSTDAVTGSFKNLPEGATFTLNGDVFKITYAGGDGNDVVLSVQSVPTLPATGFSMIHANAYLALLAAIAMAGVLAFGAWHITKRNHLS
jgi:fibronectin-binding autotransporter adhesin